MKIKSIIATSIAVAILSACASVPSGITGQPDKGSKFAKLEIGMSVKQALDIVGSPSPDCKQVTQNAYGAMVPFVGNKIYQVQSVCEVKGEGTYNIEVTTGKVVAITVDKTNNGYSK